MKHDITLKVTKAEIMLIAKAVELYGKDHFDGIKKTSKIQSQLAFEIGAINKAEVRNTGSYPKRTH